MDFEYTVLENGFDFILLSLNYLRGIYDNNPDVEVRKRLLKYSLLNASSGVELVLKYYLLKTHWIYIFADMNAAKANSFQKGEFSSADLKTILERLENLCDVVLTEEQKNSFLRLKKRRNSAEHFVLKESFEAIQASIHRSISSLIQVILQHYDLDDFNEKEDDMFIEIKDTLRSIKQHYEDAKLIAQKQLELSGMTNCVCICPECGERFLLRDDGVECRFCGYEDDAESAAELYMENIMDMNAYSTIKHGGTMPIYECPQCGNETLVLDSDNNCALCFSCDYSCESSILIFCAECNQPFEGDEEVGCICSSCLEQLVEND